MELKKCSKCGIDKDLSEFNKRKSSSDGFHYQCRECCNIDKKKYREENPEKIREYKKKYREENPDKVKEYRKRYREKNRNTHKFKKNKYNNIIWDYSTEPFNFVEIVRVKLIRKGKKNKQQETLTESTCLKCGITKPISEFYKSKLSKCSECEKERQRVYRLMNPEKRRVTKRKHIKMKKHQDPFYRSMCSLRNRTRKYLKQIGVKKDSPTLKMIGCTPDELRKYLEDRFLEGMSWDNYGIDGWHIDHIIPISSAKTLDEVKMLCHYTNYQPLWAEDNLKKGTTITPEYIIKKYFPYNEITSDNEVNLVEVKIDNNRGLGFFW
jgi:hypothetical protein